MEVKVYDMEGKEVGTMDLSEDIFAIPVNVSLMHEAVKNYLANQRQGTQSTLTRTEVRGGGKKPWRQKGTGRARQGSTRAPQWRHGGVALGPKPRSDRYSMNKKAKRLALKSAFSAKVAEGKFIVVDKLELAEIKTKSMIKVLDNLKVEDKALVVLEGANVPVVKSTKNIPTAKTLYVNTLNVYEILKYDTFIATKEAVNKIQEVYK